MNNTLRAVLVLILLILQPGCVNHNLVKSGDVTIKKLDSENATIQQVHLYQAEDQVVIYGTARSSKPGHIDIAITGSDSSVVKYLSTGYSLPHAHKRPSVFTASFSVRFPLIVSRGSVVRIGHHDALYKSVNIFDCGSNVALP